MYKENHLQQQQLAKFATTTVSQKRPFPFNPVFVLFTEAVKFCKCYQTVKSKAVIPLVQDDDDDDIE